MVKFISRKKYRAPQNIMHRLYKYFTIYNIKDMTDITLRSFQYIYTPRQNSTVSHVQILTFEFYGVTMN